MLEMKITITATDLAQAINNLAAALNGNTEMPTPKEAAPVASAPAAQPATPTAPVNPTPAPVAPMTTPASTPNVAPATMPTTANPTMPVAGAPLSATPAQPVTPAANTAPANVPTAAPQYTLDMIATAGSALIDAGKMDQLMQLLAKFGVASLTELAPDNYGAVATELRTLGAAI